MEEDIFRCFTTHGEYDTCSCPKTSVHEASFLE